MTDSQHFRWGLSALDSAKALLHVLPPHLQVVDFEVIPRFDGGADGIFVWFICATREARARFSAETMTAAKILLREEMSTRGFPESALETLETGVTSEEDIADGGGRFSYFR